MDKVVIVLVVLAVYIGLIVLFFVYLAPLMIALGAVAAFVVTLVNFLLAINDARQGKEDQADNEPPAFRKYVFRRGIQDLLTIIGQTWRRDIDILETICHRAYCLVGGSDGVDGRLWFSWPLVVVLFTSGGGGLL